MLERLRGIPMEVMGERIYLKLLTPEDVGMEYVEWMNDEDVVGFLESRWQKHTLEDLREYVRLMSESRNDYMFGIYLKENERHIGNIKIGGVDKVHRFGDLGLLIGDKGMWGKGYGAEAIGLATRYAFETLDLNKLVAGIYAVNKGSYKAFLKASYKRVGVREKHRMYRGKYVDEILVEKSRD